MRNNLNLPLTLLANRHRIPQVPHPSIDLNFIMQKLFKSGDVEDLVRGRDGGVDCELVVIAIRLATHDPN